jgi:hypothetical protein
MPEIFLPLAAIEALCNDELLGPLMLIKNLRQVLQVVSEHPPFPDWVVAGLNCKNDADILPMCIHTFLLDWRPK